MGPGVERSGVWVTAERNCHCPAASAEDVRKPWSSTASALGMHFYCPFLQPFLLPRHSRSCFSCSGYLLWYILMKDLMFLLKPHLLCCTLAYQVWRWEVVLHLSVKVMGGFYVLLGMFLPHGLALTTQGNITCAASFGVLLWQLLLKIKSC